jgi:ribosomal protein S18 acetylase RimI-like enzyme
MALVVTRYPRLRMRLTLSKRELSSQWPLGRIAVSDVAALGTLMLSAYRGTVDDEGETLEEATAEVERTLAGDYGPFLADCSFRANDGRSIVGACMVTLWERHPLVAHIVVHPDAQRKGIGTVLLTATGNALLAVGYSELELLVTEGNESAVNLYRKVGFEAVDRLTGAPDDARGPAP